MKVNQEERAFKAWNVLVDRAQERSLISYKELGGRIGIHHRAVKHVLSLIQDYCLENGLPPLTILVINQGTKRPGEGFIAWDIEDAEDGITKVYDYNWRISKNPFGFTEAGMTSEDLVKDLLNNPDSAAEIYALIKVRGITQRIFRNALLCIYNNSCCMCGLSLDAVLEACHIIPYSLSGSEQRLDVRNGLLLCSNHHKMFDRGIITINLDYTIHYHGEKKKGHSKYDKLLKKELHGKRIAFPDNVRERPNKQYLSWHQNSFI